MRVHQAPALRGRPISLALAVVASFHPAALPAATCDVPSVGYPTVAAALADPTCDPIQVAAGTFVENPAITRDVTVQGAGSTATTIAGWVRVAGASTDASFHGLRIDASATTATLCSASGLDVRGGARAAGLDLVVVGRPALIASCAFIADGFESGDLGAWSAARP